MVQLSRSRTLQSAITAAKNAVQQLQSGGDSAVEARDFLRTLTTTAFGRCALGLGASSTLFSGLVDATVAIERAVEGESLC